MQVYNTISLVTNHYNDDVKSLVLHWGVCDFRLSALSAINPTILLLLLPILDLLIVPLLRHIMFHPSILKRLGIGAFCILMSALSLLALEGIRDQVFTENGSGGVINKQEEEVDNQISSYWLILPETLITLAEIFVYIPGKLQRKSSHIN